MAAEEAEDAASAAEQASGRRRAAIFVAVAIVVILLLILVPATYRKWHAAQVAEENRYNGFDFSPVERGSLTYWRTLIRVNSILYPLELYYHPRETERVGMETGLALGLVDSATRPAALYLTLSPEAGSTVVIAGVEISKITGFQFGYLNIPTYSALQSLPEDAVAEMRVVTCADATGNATVISFEKGDADILYRDRENPGCIHLQYTDANESVRVADRFVYGLLGIMAG